MPFCCLKSPGLRSRCCGSPGTRTAPSPGSSPGAPTAAVTKSLLGGTCFAKSPSDTRVSSTLCRAIPSPGLPPSCSTAPQGSPPSAQRRLGGQRCVGLAGCSSLRGLGRGAAGSGVRGAPAAGSGPCHLSKSCTGWKERPRTGQVITSSVRLLPSLWLL